MLATEDKDHILTVLLQLCADGTLAHSLSLAAHVTLCWPYMILCMKIKKRETVFLYPALTVWNWKLGYSSIALSVLKKVEPYNLNQ